MQSSNSHQSNKRWQCRALRIKKPEEAENYTDIIIPKEIRQGMYAWKNKRNRFTVLVFGFSALPERRTREWWDMATTGLVESQINQELLIDFTSKGGSRVFPYLEYDRDKFVRPSYGNAEDGFNIPNHWPVIAGLDYGGSLNPTAICWIAIDESKQWHLIDEYYEPSHYSHVAEYLLGHPLYKRCMHIAADPATWHNRNHDTREDRKGEIVSLIELMEEEGVYKFERAINDRLAGLERVRWIFNQITPNSKSRIYISEDCYETIRELSRLVYKRDTSAKLRGSNPTEDVEKKDDHMYDALRYAAMSWDFGAEEELFKDPNSFRFDIIEDEIDEMVLMEGRDAFL